MNRYVRHGLPVRRTFRPLCTRPRRTRGRSVDDRVGAPVSETRPETLGPTPRDGPLARDPGKDNSEGVKGSGHGLTHDPFSPHPTRFDVGERRRFVGRPRPPLRTYRVWEWGHHGHNDCRRVLETAGAQCHFGWTVNHGNLDTPSRTSDSSPHFFTGG